MTAYEADYRKTFTPVPLGFSVTHLKAAALRPNDQLAIEEIDQSRLENSLTAKSPELAELFAAAEQNRILKPLDALGEARGGYSIPTASTSAPVTMRLIT